MGETSLCPKFQKAIDILSKRWNALIINQLLSGPQRFCNINDSMPISGRLLSERLKELESEGIVSRQVYPEMPVRIEYTLTHKGIALKNVLQEVDTWSKEWIKVENHSNKMRVILKSSFFFDLYYVSVEIIFNQNEFIFFLYLSF